MNSNRPDFTIVTPSYNSLVYLPRACASIADQEGASFEHIVADGLSKDGSVDWLRANPKIVPIIAKDDGMYDAVNTGLQRAEGQILAYLNCDEQYLPGTLAAVKRTFDQDPSIDIVFGDVLVVDRDGELLAFRKSYRPSWRYIVSSHLYIFSCTLFFRRRVVEAGHLFNKKYRYAGDEEFVVRLLQSGYKARRIPKYLSSFTMTGENLSISTNAAAEQNNIDSIPAWVKAMRLPLNLARLAEKAWSGAYSETFPLDYEIYGPDDLEHRRHYHAERSSYRWPSWDATSNKPLETKAAL